MTPNRIGRRNFLTLSAAAAGALVLPASAQSPAPQAVAPAAPTKPKPDPLKPELVKEFVIAGHVDLDKVKSMLATTPALLNASWDWGGGDFEMAIGGAGHMGRADIASFLISQGSRFDIFVAAMLGRLDILQPALTVNPNLATSKGPHGIPLIVHARKGGAPAAEVLKYLESLPPATT